MENVFFALSLIALVAFVVGMVNPKHVKCDTRGKVALIFMSAFIAFMFAGAACSPENDKSDEPTEVESKASNTKEEVEESAIGQIVKVGHFAYEVTNIAYRKSIGNEFYSETADGVYLLVNLRIKNISDETKAIMSDFFTLTDKDGVKFETATSVEAALEMMGKKTLLFKECQPGITTSGILAFEVPCKDEYYLYLVGDFWGEKTKKILLK